MESRGINVRSGFIEYIKGRLSSVFGPKGWPEWFGGILLGIVNIVFLALAHKPFSIYTGFYNWGAHIYQAIGASFSKAVEPVLSNVTSAGDIGLFLGAFTAALLAGEVALRKPARLLDYGEATLGGFLMALGVVFARGCNWGGFFSAITALSLHGYIMMIGLLIGGYIGALYVEWRARKEEAGLELELLEAPQAMANGGYPTSLKAPTAGFPYKLVGLVAATAVLAALLWVANTLAGPVMAGAILLGFIVGVVLQRARFCFATAFRDILRGSGEFERSVRLQIGIALGIMVGATGAAVLKYMGYVPAEAYVKPASPLGIIGGVFFGIGMVLAGGCASGSLWRAAEGHVKLWVALAAAVLSYVPLKNALSGLVGGTPVPLFKLGWAGALALVYASMAAWILFVLYLEYKRRWAVDARA